MTDVTKESDRARLVPPVLAGVAVAVGVVVLVTRLGRRQAPRTADGAVGRVLGEIVRSMVLSAATVAARRLAESVFTPEPVHPISMGRGSAPRPNSRDELMPA